MELEELEESGKVGTHFSLTKVSLKKKKKLLQICCFVTIIVLYCDFPQCVEGQSKYR